MEIPADYTKELYRYETIYSEVFIDKDICIGDKEWWWMGSYLEAKHSPKYTNLFLVKNELIVGGKQ